MNKILYILRLCLAVVTFSLTIFAFAGIFTGFLQLQLGPKIINLITTFSLISIVIVCSIFLATLLFGRLYCSIICPLGLLQDFIGTILGRKTGKTPNFYKVRYFITAIAFGALIGGSTIGFKLLDPYTNFSLIISNFLNPASKMSVVYSVLILAIIIALVVFKNRIFCTTLCPIGTILGLFSKKSLFKLNTNSNCTKCSMCESECPVGCIDNGNIDNERCTKCLRCISTCPNQAIDYKKQNKQNIEFNPSRRKFILGCTFFGFVMASTGAGFALLKNNFNKIKKAPVLPPGAKSYENLISKCTSCNLCVTNCKGNVLKSANPNCNTIHLNFDNGQCEYNCNLCNQICPTGALRKMDLLEKRHCRIGVASLDTYTCLSCGKCISICPTGAIKAKEGSENIPELNQNLCIGCGACEYNCPIKAIHVEAVDTQTIV